MVSIIMYCLPLGLLRVHDALAVRHGQRHGDGAGHVLARLQAGDAHVGMRGGEC